MNPNNFNSQSNNQEPTQHSINLFESEYFKSKEEIDKLKTQKIVEQKCKNSRRSKKSSIIWITATILSAFCLIISKTKYGKEGIGGIITKGTMYKGYPR